MESRFPFFRKRSGAVIGLLLLFSLIGFERLVLHDSGRSTGVESRVEPGTAVAPRAKAEATGGAGAVVSTPAGEPGLPPQVRKKPSPEEAVTGRIHRDGSGGPPSRLPSQIYFIRGHSLLTSRVEGQSRASAIEMLEEAVSLVTATLPEGNLVFDAEGLAASRGRFVVFAKPGYDLTDEVAVAFDQLKLQQRRQSAASPPGR